MAVSTRSAGASLQELIDGDARRLIHPHLAPDQRSRMIITGGVGCTIRDATGAEYLDATGGGLWANLVGHGRAELAEAARAELESTGFFCSFWDFTNRPAIELAERLGQLTADGLERVYYTCGGSEGIEVAIKIARLHHHRGGQPAKDWILGRAEGYHGIGHGGSAATTFDWLHEGQGPSLPHFAHLTPPWPYRTELYGSRDPTDFLVDELEAKIAELGPDRIAAFIGEPVMGVGGLLVPPADYWPRIEAVLRHHDILLILDEVVTGYGRFGSWFAHQHYGVNPDIIVTAKGLTSGYFPFGAVLLSSEIGERISADEHGFPLGYTYNGHSAGAAVAMANLDIIESERLRKRAPEAGQRLLTRLGSLRDLPIVGDVRGVGLLAGIELVSDKHTRTPLPVVDEITQSLRSEHRVIVRAAMNSCLVLSPALVISDSEIDRCVEALADVLERADADGVVARR